MFDHEEASRVEAKQAPRPTAAGAAPFDALSLQRLAGNRAVSGLLAGSQTAPAGAAGVAGSPSAAASPSVVPEGFTPVHDKPGYFHREDPLIGRDDVKWVGIGEWYAATGKDPHADETFGKSPDELNMVPDKRRPGWAISPVTLQSAFIGWEAWQKAAGVLVDPSVVKRPFSQGGPGTSAGPGSAGG